MSTLNQHNPFSNDSAGKPAASTSNGSSDTAHCRPEFDRSDATTERSQRAGIAHIAARIAISITQVLFHPMRAVRSHSFHVIREAYADLDAASAYLCIRRHLLDPVGYMLWLSNRRSCRRQTYKPHTTAAIGISFFVRLVRSQTPSNPLSQDNRSLHPASLQRKSLLNDRGHVRTWHSSRLSPPSSTVALPSTETTWRHCSLRGSSKRSSVSST